MWHKTNKPLADGWYWRKCQIDDPDPECIEVINGIIVDKRPKDSYGIEWEVYEHDEFGRWWWYGPLQVPPHNTIVSKRGNNEPM